jgi:hypothetical protein
MTKEIELKIHNSRAITVLKFCNEAWVLKKRDEKRKTDSYINETSKTPVRITKLDRKKIHPLETNWVCRTLFDKYNSINKSGYNTYIEWIETGQPSRSCSINIKLGEKQDDFTLTFKEQALLLTLPSNNGYYDDDDDDDER